MRRHDPRWMLQFFFLSLHLLFAMPPAFSPSAPFQRPQELVSRPHEDTIYCLSGPVLAILTRALTHDLDLSTASTHAQVDRVPKTYAYLRLPGTRLS